MPDFDRSHGSGLRLLAAPLIEEPLAPRPDIDQLHRRNTRRHHRRLAGTAAGVGVLGLVVALVVNLAVPGGTSSPAPAPSSHLASYVVSATQVPESVLGEVGLPTSVTAPTVLSGQPPLTDGGKPAVVYVGAEYCPYCALERWALLVALSRFGTFTDLGQEVSSSSTDVYPGLQSWSFQGSSYSSTYLTFDPAETYSSTPDPQGTGYEPLDSLTPLQQQAMDTYDGPPYSDTGSSGRSIPFIDIGNRYLAIGASASPAVLEGLSLDQIAADLTDPSSPVAQAVDGTANYLVGALCAVTGLQEPPACTAPVVAQAQQQLTAGQ